MKQILYLLFTVYCNSIFAQNLIEYSTDFGLIGDVKKIEEKSYSLTFIALLEENGRLTEQSKLDDHKIFSFNTKNMLIEEFEKEEYSDIKCQYIYDKNDSLIDIKYNHQSSLGRRFSKLNDLFKKEMMTHKGTLKSYKSTAIPSNNRYDSEGRLLKVHYQYRSYNDTKISNCSFSYANDNLKSIACYDDKEKIFSTRAYVYDEKNKIAKEVYKIFNDQGLEEKTTYFFNTKGIVEKEYSEVYKNEEIYLIVEKNYKNFNNLSTISTNFVDNTIRNEIKAYDSKGNLLSYNMTDKKGDSILYKNSELYTYDKYSNILSSKKTFFGPKTDYSIEEEFKYTYDKNGNWIIKCTCIDKAPVKTTLRQIDYYDSNTDKTISKADAIFFCDPQYEQRLEKLKQEVEKNYNKGFIDVEEKN